MQLALQTDPVRAMPFEQVLDLCVDVRGGDLEIPNSRTHRRAAKSFQPLLAAANMA